MELRVALAADLGLLTAAVFDPDMVLASDVARTVLVLARTAGQAVASFVGLSVTVTEHCEEALGRVVLRFTLLEDQVDLGDVATSLLLPGPTGAPRDQLGIQVVLYASTPGAFVDLVADLAFLTGREVDAANLDQHQGLAGEPDIIGVRQTESVIGEAIGVFIDDGYTREQAYTELDTLAGAAHTDRITEATRVVADLRSGRPGVAGGE